MLVLKNKNNSILSSLSLFRMVNVELEFLERRVTLLKSLYKNFYLNLMAPATNSSITMFMSF
jgi:hypothetical protein